jgi:wobble nucleotide-excising tRNase
VGLKSSQHSPSFGNALSQSDKDVLALAFFLGRVDTLPGDAVAEPTLVFDDPVVGFDRRRRSAAGNALLEVTERGAQVIVLTHQPEFADELLAEGFSQSLCIRRDGDRSVIDAYPSDGHLTVDH